MPEEARPYHHGSLRETLVELARQQLSAEGAESISLRALAREAGVSEGAPYRHFKTKTCLFAAMVRRGFVDLRESLLEVTARHPDDVEKRFVELGRAYIRWATGNPAMYQLFFDSSIVDIRDYPEVQEAGEASYAVMLECIADGIERGVFVDRPLHELGGYAWALVHGVSSLICSKSHMAPQPQDRKVVQSMAHLVESPESVIEMGLLTLKNR